MVLLSWFLDFWSLFFLFLWLFSKRRFFRWIFKDLSFWRMELFSIWSLLLSLLRSFLFWLFGFFRLFDRLSLFRFFLIRRSSRGLSFRFFFLFFVCWFFFLTLFLLWLIFCWFLCLRLLTSLFALFPLFGWPSGVLLILKNILVDAFGLRIADLRGVFFPFGGLDGDEEEHDSDSSYDDDSSTCDHDMIKLIYILPLFLKSINLCQ